MKISRTAIFWFHTLLGKTDAVGVVIFRSGR